MIALISVGFEIMGLKEARDEVGNIRRALVDATPVWQEATEGLRSIALAKFGARKRVRRSTLRAQTERWGYYGRTPGVPGRPLVWGGELLRSFVDPGSRFHVEEIRPRDMRFGSKYFKAFFHRVTRRMFRLSTKQVDELFAKPMARHLEASVRGFRERGFGRKSGLLPVRR